MGTAKIALSELHLWDKNPRTIKDKRFNALCKSMTDDPSFLELRPVLATKDGRIYAGNMRYRAATHLGWKDIPAIITDIPEKLARERAIKDNNEYGEWNNDELATLLDEMEKAGTDLSLLGLDDSIQKIIDQLNEKEIVEDEVLELKKDPNTKLGDLWQLGEHRLLCGDATKIDDVERLMDGQKADMVFTDPPYGYEYQSNHQSKHKMLENDNVFLDFLPMEYAFSQENSAHYICCSWQTVDEWIRRLKDSGLTQKNLIVWKKNNWSMGDLKGAYAGQHELILFAHKGRVTLQGGRDRDVWEFNREPPKDHPTMKPVELVAKAINNHMSNIVLDFFGGSGTTLMACEQLNRKCFMMELDPQYVRVIIDRWEKLTGEKAVLE